MPYEIHLYHFEGGERVPGPFPGPWPLIEQVWDRPPDEYGFTWVRRGDTEGELWLPHERDEPIDSMIFSRMGGEGYFGLMYEIAEAGDMVILPQDGPFCLLREEQRQHLPPGTEDEIGAVVVSSEDEFHAALEDT